MTKLYEVYFYLSTAFIFFITYFWNVDDISVRNAFKLLAIFHPLQETYKKLEKEEHSISTTKVTSGIKPRTILLKKNREVNFLILRNYTKFHNLMIHVYTTLCVMIH